MRYSDSYVQHWADHVRVTAGAAELERQDETAKAIEITNSWAMSCADKLEWKEECRDRNLPWKSALITASHSDGVESFATALDWLASKHVQRSDFDQ